MDHIQPHWTIRWSSSAQPLLSLMDISIHDRGWMSKLWWKGPNRTWFIWSLWMPPLQNGFWVGKRTWKLRISDKNSIEDFCNFTHRHLHCSVFIDLDWWARTCHRVDCLSPNSWGSNFHSTGPHTTVYIPLKSMVDTNFGEMNLNNSYQRSNGIVA